MCIIKRPATTIPKESAHGGSGARKVYVSAEHATSPYCEAITHGWLPAVRLLTGMTTPVSRKQ